MTLIAFVSLMSNDGNYLIMCLLTICISAKKKWLVILFGNWILIVLSCKHSLYIHDTVHYQTNDLQIFFLIVWMCLHFLDGVICSTVFNFDKIYFINRIMSSGRYKC